MFEFSKDDSHGSLSTILSDESSEVFDRVFASRSVARFVVLLKDSASVLSMMDGLRGEDWLGDDSVGDPEMDEA